MLSVLASMAFIRYTKLHTIYTLLLIIFLLCVYMNRYRGELFGLGTNHTKYKSKNGGYTGGSSSNATGISLQTRIASTEQLYSAASTSTVHYPSAGNGATPTHHSTSSAIALAASYQSFEESNQVHEMNGIYGSP